MYFTVVHNDIDHACRDLFWSRNFLLLQFGTEFCAPRHFSLWLFYASLNLHFKKW